MYLPPQFATQDAAIARELMRAHPFANLVGTDDEGLPFVTHLPLHLVEEGTASQDIVLLRPNYVVDAPQAAFYLAIVRNHSADRAWCVRPKGTVRGETAEGVTVSPDNFLVAPGQYSVLMMALVAKDGAGRYDYSDAIATTFWPPDPSAPAATACRGRVPSQLDAWLADPGYRSYPDFLASRETEQEALDATRLSDEDLQDVFDLEPVEDE